MPIFIPPLNKANNNISYNQCQNLPLFLSNIKHFKFKISKKKRIRHINFNQNKIIENTNKTNEEKQTKPIIQLFSKIPQSNGVRKNSDNERDNDNNINNNVEQKSEIYQQLMHNEKLKNMNIQLGKSHSTGLFPKIKIT